MCRSAIRRLIPSPLLTQSLGHVIAPSCGLLRRYCSPAIVNGDPKPAICPCLRRDRQDRRLGRKQCRGDRSFLSHALCCVPFLPASACLLPRVPALNRTPFSLCERLHTLATRAGSMRHTGRLPHTQTARSSASAGQRRSDPLSRSQLEPSPHCAWSLTRSPLCVSPLSVVTLI